MTAKLLKCGRKINLFKCFHFTYFQLYLVEENVFSSRNCVFAAVCNDVDYFVVSARCTSSMRRKGNINKTLLIWTKICDDEFVNNIIDK